MKKTLILSCGNGSSANVRTRKFQFVIFIQTFIRKTLQELFLCYAHLFNHYDIDEKNITFIYDWLFFFVKKFNNHLTKCFSLKSLFSYEFQFRTFIKKYKYNMLCSTNNMLVLYTLSITFFFFLKSQDFCYKI